MDGWLYLQLDTSGGLTSIAGSVSVYDAQPSVPATYREPLCPSKALPSAGRRQHRLGRHYPAVVAHTGSCAGPPPSHRLRFSLGRWVFAGCCESLLEDGPSRRYLHKPCIGAWTHTPSRPFGAHTHYFPNGIGLTQGGTGSARETPPRRDFYVGEGFRGCSHSFTFRLLCSLDPLVAPTAVAFLPGSWAVYTTQWTRGCPHELWHRYMHDLGNLHGRTPTCWFMALSAATSTPPPSIAPRAGGCLG